MSKHPLPYHSSPEERAKRQAEKANRPVNPENVKRFLRALNGPHPDTGAPEPATPPAEPKT